jgi:hypothetical protein
MFGQQKRAASASAIPDRLRAVRHEDERVRTQAAGRSPEFFKEPHTIHIGPVITTNQVNINIGSVASSATNTATHGPEAKYERSVARIENIAIEEPSVSSCCWPFNKCC